MKTSELTGAQLDWAVAKCEGYTELRRNPHRFCPQLIMASPLGSTVFLADLMFSTDWGMGGPLLESFQNNESTFCLFFNPYKDHPEYGNSRPWKAEHKGHSFYAETPLVASMRCFIASRLGDEVEIPEELK